VLNGSNTGKSAVTDSTGTYVMHDLVAETFRLRATASNYDGGEQNVSVPAVPRADFILAKSCGYILTPSSGTVSPGDLLDTFAVTPTTANDCAWTASTPDAWVTIIGPTTGAGSGTIGYAVVPSGVTRTGSVVVSWSTGNARFSFTATASTCPAPTTLTFSSSAGGSFLTMGAGCIRGTTQTIDVPWIHINGTMGGATLLEVSVDANGSGAPRTGHITFVGDSLSTQVTFQQS
jgi:hypothetical protein